MLLCQSSKHYIVYCKHNNKRQNMPFDLTLQQGCGSHKCRGYRFVTHFCLSLAGERRRECLDQTCPDCPVDTPSTQPSVGSHTPPLPSSQETLEPCTGPYFWYTTTRLGIHRAQPNLRASRAGVNSVLRPYECS